MHLFARRVKLPMRELSAIMIVSAFLFCSVADACPNMCSGHGDCTPDARCVCWKSNYAQGLYWIGADCSKRKSRCGKVERCTRLLFARLHNHFRTKDHVVRLAQLHLAQRSRYFTGPPYSPMPQRKSLGRHCHSRRHCPR